MQWDGIYYKNNDFRACFINWGTVFYIKLSNLQYFRLIVLFYQTTGNVSCLISQNIEQFLWLDISYPQGTGGELLAISDNT